MLAWLDGYKWRRTLSEIQQKLIFSSSPVVALLISVLHDMLSLRCHYRHQQHVPLLDYCGNITPQLAFVASQLPMPVQAGEGNLFVEVVKDGDAGSDHSNESDLASIEIVVP
mmetsp:Transcript_36917/g.59190  ORF Transcript_36917/g.59190 Transcript_36917/m.59190 type:complete len:112 (-) Transcript_36917:601-936(-)